MVDPITERWPRDALPKGTELHGFRLEAMLGRGGFGITYRAVDAIDQNFAIKECFPRQFATRQDSIVYPADATEAAAFADCIERFTKEAKTLRHLSEIGTAGNGVVKVVTFFAANGTGYLVMEYLSGQNLDDAIRAAPQGLPAEQVAFMLPRLLHAVGCVHDAGLLHRDIKPANILLRADGTPVLIDFGAVRGVPGQGQTVTFTQIYSEGYAPIEQMVQGKQGTFSDLYALGATFYRAIGGRIVDSFTRHQAILRGKPDPQVPAMQIGSGRYPANLLAAIDAALTIDPHDRPQTVRDVMQLLGETAAVMPAPAAEPVLPPPRQAAGPSRLPMMLAALAGIAVIGGAAIAGGVYWLNSRPPAHLTEAPVAEQPAAPRNSALADQALAARNETRALAARVRASFSALGLNADSELAEIDRSMASAEGIFASGDFQAALDRFLKLTAALRQLVGNRLDSETAKQASSAGQAKLQQAKRDLLGETTPALAAPALPNADDAMAKGRAAFDAKDYGQALRWCQQAADQGNAEAERCLGLIYANGHGVPVDYALALRWFQKAADQGYADAQVNIALLYDQGQGVAVDHAQALRWFQKAADQGHALAEVKIGQAYQTGAGLPVDYAQAMRWYLKAADQGNAFAEAYIGLLYQSGSGVKVDYRQAMLWYQKAADKGSVEAELFIGFLYQQGLGVPVDYGQAMRWYQKVADQGNAIGQRSLGLLYAKGLGVRKDCAVAKGWYDKAAAQGDKDAKAWLAANAGKGNFCS